MQHSCVNHVAQSCHCGQSQGDTDRGLIDFQCELASCEGASAVTKCSLGKKLQLPLNLGAASKKSKGLPENLKTLHPMDVHEDKGETQNIVLFAATHETFSVVRPFASRLNILFRSEVPPCAACPPSCVFESHTGTYKAPSLS